MVDAVIKASYKANVVGPDATLRRVRAVLLVARVGARPAFARSEGIRPD